MAQKIRTTHVGSLPRTPELLEANQNRASGSVPDEAFFEILEKAVDEVVARQVELGIDIINEGEYGHITSGAIDYGAWWNYSFSRLGGLTMTDVDRWASEEVVRSEPGKPRLTSFSDRRDRALFNEAYEDPESGIFTGRAKVGNPEFTGPITYVGQKEVEADVKLLKDAMAKHNVTDVPFGDILEEILRAEVGGYTFEAASPRHAHEWKIWKDVELPDNVLLYPGVIAHSTNVVEHPELVADRISNFAEVVGPDKVVASTDCGLGGRLHHQIAWAKLDSLVKGAEIASKRLY